MAYQLKITLKNIRPPIWRRIQVNGDITLFKLHRIIQAVMGWYDYHLHRFEIYGIEYGVPTPDDFYPVKNEKRVKLSKLVTEENDRFLYEYDYGDSWEHEILVEKILPAEKGMYYPVCIKGKRACPPEDVGGAWGYADFLEAIRDPDHPEHEDYANWLEEDFDPEEFDLEEINRMLEKIR